MMYLFNFNLISIHAVFSRVATKIKIGTELVNSTQPEGIKEPG